MSHESPKIPANYFQEQAGVLAIASAAYALRCIWRPTPNADLGIDGQLELIDTEGASTGKIVAVQIKSGTSYFDRADEFAIDFYPERKHRKYWADFPIPVVLALHDPETGLIHWTDARRQLRRRRETDTSPIAVPRGQVFGSEMRESLFETCGAFDIPLLSIPQVASMLASETSGSTEFKLSFLDLFTIGKTDIGRKLYFSLDLCLQILGGKAVAAFPSMWGHNEFSLLTNMHQRDYAFLDRYVRFLLSQNLIFYDFYDYLIDWEDRFVTPVFVCPFTPRGLLVQEFIQALTEQIKFCEHSLRLEFRYDLPSLVLEVERVRAKLLAVQLPRT
jgi:hypothetical protein